MAYRDDLTALSARHDALAGEVADKTRELDDARHLLEQARARTRLPVLDNLRVASPCTADWSQMTGDDRTRHCGACQKNVYNLSGMTRDEAEALLIERNGQLCVRYYERADGTILLADCVIGAKRRRRNRRVAAGAAALLAGSFVAAAMHPTRAVMGDMAEPVDHARAPLGKMEVAVPPVFEPGDDLRVTPPPVDDEATAPRTSMRLLDDPPKQPAPPKRPAPPERLTPRDELDRNAVMTMGVIRIPAMDRTSRGDR